MLRNDLNVQGLGNVQFGPTGEEGGAATTTKESKKDSKEPKEPKESEEPEGLVAEVKKYQYFSDQEVESNPEAFGRVNGRAYMKASSTKRKDPDSDYIVAKVRFKAIIGKDEKHYLVCRSAIDAFDRNLLGTGEHAFLNGKDLMFGFRPAAINNGKNKDLAEIYEAVENDDKQFFYIQFFAEKFEKHTTTFLDKDSGDLFYHNSTGRYATNIFNVATKEEYDDEKQRIANEHDRLKKQIELDNLKNPVVSAGQKWALSVLQDITKKTPEEIEAATRILSAQ